MRTMTASESRQRYKETLDRVVDDAEPVLVTRSGGRESVVIISQREYESLKETAYLLSSPASARRLMQSVAELDAGKGEPHDLLEA